MLKNILSTYIAVVFAGITLMFIQEAYLENQLEELADINKQEAHNSRERQAKASESLAKEDKKVQAEVALLLCQEALRTHHSKQPENLEVIRNTSTFAAFTYTVSGTDYHSKCVVDERNSRVLSFDASKR